ncbi:MAG: hypothetical protein JJT76_06490 [Clostridiaceae bacterium]|nr:hypothetical protein [Clostridiaceae bacterium]
MFGLILMFGLPALMFVGINKVFKIYYLGFKGMLTLYGFCFLVCYVLIIQAYSIF